MQVRGEPQCEGRFDLHQADDVSLGVGEERDGRVLGDLGERHDYPPAKLLDPSQGRRRAFGMDVMAVAHGLPGTPPAPHLPTRVVLGRFRGIDAGNGCLG